MRRNGNMSELEYRIRWIEAKRTAEDAMQYKVEEEFRKESDHFYVVCGGLIN